MEILIITLFALTAYIILTLLAVNLIGMAVRFLISNPEDKKREEALYPNLKPKLISTAVFFFLIILAALLALFHFGNIWAAVALLILMIARLPDLLFEIKTGQKITKQNMPRGAIYVLGSVLGWLGLPLLWYSIYTYRNII